MSDENKKSSKQQNNKKPAPKGWTCSCGAKNKGNFCAYCGKPRPASASDQPPAPKSAPKQEAKTQPAPKSASKPETKPQPAPKPAPKPETKPQPAPKSAPKPETKPQPAPKPEQKLQTEPRPVPKRPSEPSPAPKTEQKPQTEPRPVPKRPSEPSSAPKTEQKPQTEPRPIPKRPPEPSPAPKTEAGMKSVPKPEKPPVQPKKEFSGPPISEEEMERRLGAMDALDRDLEKARRKQLQEEAYRRHQYELEKQKEAENRAKAEKEKERLINAEETKQRLKAAEEKRVAEAKAAKEAERQELIKSGKLNEYESAKKFNSALNTMASLRALVVLAVLVVIGYIGAHVYINNLNNEIYEQIDARLTGQSRMVSDSSIEYDVPSMSPLSLSDKTARGLSAGLADSDKDGLTDYDEINTYGTDPLEPDSDGDGVYDGAEVRAGLDPLNPKSDGVTPDNQVLRDVVIAEGQVSARIKGLPKTYDAMLTKLENNSIQGTPGLVSHAYEFYSVKSFESCTLSFTYTDEQINEKGFNKNALSIYRFNADTLAFEKITSEASASSNAVSAQIAANGIYALCDSSILMAHGKTNIYFLIDNSGSMYPQELMPNSEENDVEFKRLDFAMDLVDMLGSDANYGAAEFVGQGSYARIAAISNDSESVKSKISAIRNRVPTFNGTDIAGAITGAVSEFGAVTGYDRNYIILLTDGMPSEFDAAREAAAVQAAKRKGITVFTIGLGKYVDTDYLYNIAEETNGQFFQASNADALANIYEKIRDFMSYNQVTIEEESGRKGYILADSGFNVQRDGIGYSNFRVDFAPNGADVGIAGLIRSYYTGELQLFQPGYVDMNGNHVPEYDLTKVKNFSDSRVDLKNVQINALYHYNKYMHIKDKWDYNKINDGVLQYTADTRKEIDETHLIIYNEDYEFEEPHESGFVKFLRGITLNQIRRFTGYECVMIDSSAFSDDDAEIMNMIRWYCNIPYAPNKCTIYDFGYQGDAAFEALINELNTGSPAVITYGGSAMNAVRIARDALDPNTFVLDAYDSNTPDRSTRITIVRTPVYTNGDVTYQYTASRGSVEEPLRIIIMK